MLSLLFLAALLSGCAESGSRSRSRADARAGEDGEDLVVEGSVALVGTEALEVGVDRGQAVAYVAGGMGQTGLVAVDVSDPASMTVVPFGAGFGGGVAADPLSGLVASTSGFGATIGVFTASDARFDEEPIPGCGGSLAAGAPGVFAASMQCVDTLSIYDAAAGVIVFETPSAGVSSSVHYNAATGRFYLNRTPRSSSGRFEPLVIAPAPVGGAFFATSDLGIEGFLLAVDPVRNRLYFHDLLESLAPAQGGRPAIVVLDGDTHAPALPEPIAAPASGAVAIAVAADAGRIFLADHARNTIVLFDATTGAPLAALDFGAATGGFTMAGRPLASDGDRAYQVGSRPGAANHLFVIGRRPRGV